MVLDCAHQNPWQSALFSLIPLNDSATDAVNDVVNKEYVSLSRKHQELSFDIGFHIDNKSSKNTLVTFGRNDCNIVLQDETISRLHCSFEMDDLDTGIVMFHDRSHARNTRVSGEFSQPFEDGRSPRRVLVYRDCNDLISMGGKYGNLYQFRIEWILDEDKVKAAAERHKVEKKEVIINPRTARTHDPTETILPSQMITPDQAFQKHRSTGMRYFKMALIGVGSFGKVWRVIDVDSGKLMAMKHIEWVPRQRDQEHVRKVRREVELMRRAKHVRPRFATTDFDDAYFKVATHRRLNHIPGLGEGVLLCGDIRGSGGEKPGNSEF